jgi:hypothetical protein
MIRFIHKDKKEHIQPRYAKRTPTPLYFNYPVFPARYILYIANAVAVLTSIAIILNRWDEPFPQNTGSL